MMKYTKYRITKEMNKYYIEVPFLFFFWQRLYHFRAVEIGTQTMMTKTVYEFKRYEDASSFAEENMYLIIKVN